MAKISIDAELALHEFSVRYREGLAQADSANALQSFLGTVKEQFAEAQKQHSHEQQSGHDAGAQATEAPQREIEEHEAGE